MRCPSCDREFPVGEDPPRFCPLCGRSLPEATQIALTQVASPVAPRTAVAAEAPPPETIGPYRLLGLLGRGGMGSVYDAEEAGSGRRAALKLVSPELIASAEARERFRQEGRVASRIAHPRCVFVLAADLDGDQPFIAMERMPGETLQDRVARGGPLPVGEAVAFVLDVVDGLREAHRLQVIHRDMKPSNCYLDASGRVKVGDFGLARPIAGDAGLTRTGAFVGTPLYASPEQIRGEPLDPRTDVYSVSATLFFLLTGRTPFEGGDLGAALGRILGGPTPDLAAGRPGVPPALARVVARGLERDRERRWRDLDHLRRALLPFVPAQAEAGSLGLRLGAWLVDFLFLATITLLLQREVLELIFGENLSATLSWTAWGSDALLWVAYFGALDGVWGASLGKRLLGLRVCGLVGLAPPGLARGTVRALLYFAIVELPHRLVDRFTPSDDPDLLWMWTSIGCGTLGVAALGSTMRLRNGNRGVHDLLSKSRVVQMVPREEETAIGVVVGDEAPLPRPADVPDRIGPYAVRGVVPGAARTLVAEDPSLARPVRIVLRPKGDGPLPEARRTLDRPARARWIAGGELGEDAWNAFVAPEGTPLLVWTQSSGRMEWADARPVLARIAEECVLARADGTLPHDLSIERVRVHSSGRVQIEDDGRAAGDAAAEASAERSLSLVREAASWMLEGRPSSPRPRGAEVACFSCGERFEPIRPREEGILREANCPTCGQWRPLPMSLGQRVALWIFLVVVGGLLVALLSAGRGKPIGLLSAWLTLGTAWTLAKDLRIRIRHEDAGRPVRAPIPIHASGLLARADGEEAASLRLARLRDDLLRAEGRGARVLAPARFAHVLVFSALMLLPCCSMLVGSHSAMIIELERLEEAIEHGEAALVAIADAELLREMLSASDQRDMPSSMASWIRASIARDRGRLAEARRSLGWSGRWIARSLAEEPRRVTGGDVARRFETVRGAEPGLRIHRRLSDGSESSSTFGPDDLAEARFNALLDMRPRAVELLAPSFVIVVGVLVLLLVWPLAVRGGLSFRLAGLALVRRSGAPAIRLQWFLRSIALWGPFAGLLYAAAIADFDRPAHSPTLRACALALLPLYALLALRYPRRGPHDVLLGTCVVRR